MLGADRLFHIFHRKQGSTSGLSSVSTPAVTTIPVPRARARPAAVLATFMLTFVLFCVSLPRPGVGARAMAVAGAGRACQQVLQVVRNRLDVPKVAETSFATLSHLKLTATSFSEVSNRTQITIDGAKHVPAVVEVLGRLHSILLSSELDVHVPAQMVTLVVTHAHLLNLPVFFLTLKKYIFKEVLKLLLDLMVAHVGQMGAIC